MLLGLESPEAPCWSPCGRWREEFAAGDFDRPNHQTPTRETMKKINAVAATVLGATVMLLPIGAKAQAADNWKFEASINGYLPTIGGSTIFPPGAGGEQPQCRRADDHRPLEDGIHRVVRGAQRPLGCLRRRFVHRYRRVQIGHQRSPAQRWRPGHCQRESRSQGHGLDAGRHLPVRSQARRRRWMCSPGRDIST